MNQTTLFLCLLGFVLSLQACKKEVECPDTPYVSIIEEANTWIAFGESNVFEFENDNTGATANFEVSILETFVGGGVANNPSEDCASPDYRKVKTASIYNADLGNYSIDLSYASQVIVQGMDNIRFEAITKEIITKAAYLDLVFHENYSFKGQIYEEAIEVICNDAQACASNEIYGFIVAKNKGYIQITDANGDTWSLL